MIRVGLVLASSMLLSGCVGLGVGMLGNIEDELSNPRIQIAKGNISSTEGTAPWLTAEDLRRYWGPPDRIRAAGRTERWQYNFGVRWNGVGVLVAFVPLPLLIPVGHEYIEFTIENGAVVKAKAVEDDWVGMYGCVASGIPHASGTGCLFGGEKTPTRFVQAGHPSKIRVINATGGAVSVALKHKTFISRDPPFTLEARQSRNVLGYFRADIVATTGEGRTVAYDGGNPAAYAFDSTVAYLITRDRVVPIPPEYWDTWEAHIDDIVRGRP
jgi:hypothetical protein